MLIGYARVSTIQKCLGDQLGELCAAWFAQVCCKLRRGYTWGGSFGS